MWWGLSQAGVGSLCSCAVCILYKAYSTFNNPKGWSAWRKWAFCNLSTGGPSGIQTKAEVPHLMMGSQAAALFFSKKHGKVAISKSLTLANLMSRTQHNLNGHGSGGSWVAQWVKRPTSAQVLISKLVSLSPASDSVLTAQSLEPASDSVFLSLCPSSACNLFLSLTQNKH